MSGMTISLPLLQAAGDTSAQAGIFNLVLIGLVFLIFYMLIFRPQRKREKESQQMRENLKKGDKVQSIGGIRGVVQDVKEDSVIVKVDDNTKLEFSKSAISGTMDKNEKKEEKDKK